MKDCHLFQITTRVVHQTQAVT